MHNSPQQIADGVNRLVSFPDVAHRIDEMIADERSSSADIGRLVEPDPALSSALLRIANSAAFRPAAAIDSVETAVRVVGTKEVRDLTYATSTNQAFSGIPNDLISVEDFWRHSLYVAVISQNLASAARMCRGVSLFTAGLLHDIGHLVMFNQCPKRSREALRLSLDIDDGRSSCSAEQNIFGFDHTEVGAALARNWNFPDTLVAAIANHHAPFADDDQTEVAVLVHVANSIAVMAELESESFGDAPPIESAARERLGLDDKSLLEIGAVSHAAVEELVGLFAS